MKKTVSCLLLLIIFSDVFLPLYAFSSDTSQIDANSSINVLCNVAGAEIYLDGKKTGYITPVAEPVMTVPGFHQMRIEKKGYTVWRKDILLTEGERYTASALMVPVSVSEKEEPLIEDNTFATISIAAAIDGASLYIDGKDTGLVTPLAEPLNVAPGYHQLRIEKKGFTAFRKDLTLMAGEKMEIEAILVPVEVTESQEKAFENMDKKPINKRWWFWVLVLAAVGSAIASEDSSSDGGSVLVTW